LFDRRLPMCKRMLVVAALLFGAAAVAIPLATAGETMRSAGDVLQIKVPTPKASSPASAMP
jgi:hypothetical protein